MLLSVTVSHMAIIFRELYFYIMQEIQCHFQSQNCEDYILMSHIFTIVVG